MSYLSNTICFYTQRLWRKRGNTESLADTAGQTLGVLHVAYDPSCCQSLMNQARNTSKDVLHGPHACVANLPPHQALASPLVCPLASPVVCPLAYPVVSFP